MAWFQSKITISSRPRYNWDIARSRGVTRSGWNPFRGLRVALIDESLSKDRLSIFIEPSAPGTSMFFFMFLTPMIILLPALYPIAVTNAQARGYFFSKNLSTGKIDLLHRVKPFWGDEVRTVFEDVTDFGIKFIRDEAFENLYASSFVLTFKEGQIRIPNGECFVLSHHKELEFLMDTVNALIARSLESRMDLNSVVYPLLSTGRPDEHVAIPFAASCLCEGRGEASAFAAVSADEMDGNESSYRDGEYTARSEEYSPDILVFSSAAAAPPAPHPEVQEAQLISDLVYRQPFVNYEFPNVPY